MYNKLELNWIGKYTHSNQIKPEPRLLYENKEFSYNAEAPTQPTLDETPKTHHDNYLIHGDNLLALKALEREFAGKVKCVYIDPPYNTGSTFEHYDDNLEHSTWLNLMRPRLELLKNLLSEDGFLICQIDDSEGHYIKVLLDEIFGRSNYLNTFYIQVRYANKTLAEDSDYQKIIEQCHVYSKRKN